MRNPANVNAVPIERERSGEKRRESVQDASRAALTALSGDAHNSLERNRCSRGSPSKGSSRRIAPRASTSRATGPDRQPRLASWHIDHLCPGLPRDCDMPGRLGIDEIYGGVRVLGTAYEIVPFTPFAQLPASARTLKAFMEITLDFQHASRDSVL